MADEQEAPTTDVAEGADAAEEQEKPEAPESGETPEGAEGTAAVDGEDQQEAPSKASAAAFRDLSEPAEINPKGKIDMVLDVSVPVTVELGRTEVEVGDLLKMGLGSVISLDREAGQPVDIYVRDIRFATGEIVVVDDHFAVRIRDVHDPQSSGSEAE